MAYRHRLQHAFEMPTYEKAKEALADIHSELLGVNRRVANSLTEGL